MNPAIAGISDLETGKYIEVNNTFYEKLGYARNEVIGKNAADLLKLNKAFRKRPWPSWRKPGESKI